MSCLLSVGLVQLSLFFSHTPFTYVFWVRYPFCMQRILYMGSVCKYVHSVPMTEPRGEVRIFQHVLPYSWQSLPDTGVPFELGQLATEHLESSYVYPTTLGLQAHVLQAYLGFLHGCPRFEHRSSCLCRKCSYPLSHILISCAFLSNQWFSTNRYTLAKHFNIFSTSELSNSPQSWKCPMQCHCRWLTCLLNS